jgi:L-cysteine:1D-myo-inositol 2-amino-2-deoxy-alpha-D-glucopyranoside ligase
MAKSVGNLVRVGDLLREHPSGGLRRYLLEHHYRGDWSFDPDALEDAVSGFRSWQKAAREPGRDAGLTGRFLAALADDLDTPAAVEVLDVAAAAGAGETVAELAVLIGVDLS